MYPVSQGLSPVFQDGLVSRERILVILVGPVTQVNLGIADIVENLDTAENQVIQG